MIYAKVLKDSLSSVGCRLTTFEVQFHRYVLAEHNTHREHSRNSASSRAIPVKKVLDQVLENPAMPIFWGKNQSGMQAYEELDKDKADKARDLWLKARTQMVKIAQELSDLGLHKQVTSRLLEPWVWTTVILSSTSYDNFFKLRAHHAAQPEMQALAFSMKDALDASIPDELQNGQWHLPLINPEDWIEVEKMDISKEERMAAICKISMGRCARVSYLTHDGRRDLGEDIKLYEKLVAGKKTNEPMHLSPCEHVAMSTGDMKGYGNFKGFKQWRQFIE
jgi:thymidylate synthase ThyX